MLNAWRPDYGLEARRINHHFFYRKGKLRTVQSRRTYICRRRCARAILLGSSAKALPRASGAEGCGDSIGSSCVGSLDGGSRRRRRRRRIGPQQRIEELLQDVAAARRPAALLRPAEGSGPAAHAGVLRVELAPDGVKLEPEGKRFCTVAIMLARSRRQALLWQCGA